MKRKTTDAEMVAKVTAQRAEIERLTAQVREASERAYAAERIAIGVSDGAAELIAIKTRLRHARNQQERVGWLLIALRSIAQTHYSYGQTHQGGRIMRGLDHRKSAVDDPCGVISDVIEAMERKRKSFEEYESALRNYRGGIDQIIKDYPDIPQLVRERLRLLQSRALHEF